MASGTAVLREHLMVGIRNIDAAALCFAGQGMAFLAGFQSFMMAGPARFGIFFVGLVVE
jgi:hypothetical protein